MDRLVPSAWLEKQLAAPDLRILDCTVSRVVLPQRRSRLPEWASSLVEGHIPGSGHVDLIEELSDLSSGLPFMLPGPQRSRTTHAGTWWHPFGHALGCARCGRCGCNRQGGDGEDGTVGRGVDWFADGLAGYFDPGMSGEW